ncbi:hypothetical protein CAPTEDRAFT_205987, partial [Capitella teleta]
MGCEKDKKDHKGRTAADLAQMMGYGNIVQLLVGAEDSLKSEIFKLKYISHTKSPSTSMNYDEFTELMKQETNESDFDTIYTSLLKSPVLGSMNYQEKCFQEEAKLVRDEVFRLINCFSEDFGHRYPLFAFTPKLRGSMAEGTKSGPPDEFDFMLQMNALSVHCGVTAIAESKAHMTFERLADIHPLMPLLLTFPPYTGHVIHSDLHPEEINVSIFNSLKEYFLKLSKLEDSHLSFLRRERMK